MKRALTINLGSSSLKLSVFDDFADPYFAPPEPLWQRSISLRPRESANLVFEQLLPSLPDGIELVVHRIVLGGSSLHETLELSPAVQEKIQELSEFAPLHNGPALELIKLAKSLIKKPHYAAFDTAFFSKMPEEATTYALPAVIRSLGVKRYGFHGLSHSYVTGRLASLLSKLPERIISLHLGSGCSLAAIHKGLPIYSTMGFTPLEGPVMGTRAGTIDPGILLYLAKSHSAEELSEILNHHSGLLGLSEQTADMKSLIELMDSGDARAKLAFDVFIHSLIKHLGSCYALLGGVDAIIFTGGIGEKSAKVRSSLLERCPFLSSEIVDELQITNSSTGLSFVIKSREELQMLSSLNLPASS